MRINERRKARCHGARLRGLGSGKGWRVCGPGEFDAGMALGYTEYEVALGGELGLPCT